MIVAAVVAITGIITPIFVALYQKKLYKLDELIAHQKIEEETHKALLQIKAQIATLHKESETVLYERLEELQNNQKQEAAKSLAAVLQLQGNWELQNEDYGASAISYLESAGKYITGQEVDNLITVLRQIELKIIPNLTGSDFKHKRIEERFRGLALVLEASNDRDIFRQWLDAFHRGVPLAIARETRLNNNTNA